MECTDCSIACTVTLRIRFGPANAMVLYSGIFDECVLLSRGKSSVEWWIFTLSTQGIAQGFQVIYRVILILVLSNLLTLTTPPLAITGALQTLLCPLKLLRIPADDIAMILSVAIQFIPTLMEETDSIKKAQLARGAKLDSRRLTERARAMLPLIIPILLRLSDTQTNLRRQWKPAATGEVRITYRKNIKSIPRSGWCALLLCCLLIILEYVL